MIFYFSGTGNSLWIAKEIAKKFNDKIISVADELNISQNNFNYNVELEENVFFVFPVHSWGPALLMLKFISKLKLANYSNQKVYAVCSCGDMCGNTNNIVKKALKRQSIKLTNCYSIQMPNNYILMSGFNIDPKEIEEQKLSNAPKTLNLIIENIINNSIQNIYTKGSMAFLKSYIIYPMFCKSLGKNSFHATELCTSCGLCAIVCPVKNIYLENERPKWEKRCVQCVACIHRCPEKAIEFGKISKTKGRYCHHEL